jgi:hypothetical protein
MPPRRARAAKHGLAGGQAAEGRGAGEADEAHHEHALAATEVGDPAAQQQETTEREGVGRDHPLPVGHRDVQGPLC